MAWAVEHGLGSHPADIRRRYSTPLLHLLFDSHWWGKYVPPSEDEPGRKGRKGGREPAKVINARGLDDSQFPGLFS